MVIQKKRLFSLTVLSVSANGVEVLFFSSLLSATDFLRESVLRISCRIGKFWENQAVPDI